MQRLPLMAWDSAQFVHVPSPCLCCGAAWEASCIGLPAPGAPSSPQPSFNLFPPSLVETKYLELPPQGMSPALSVCACLCVCLHGSPCVCVKGWSSSRGLCCVPAHQL